jgi:uncharacterized protein YdeI (YjbR/CyaY-like superfamily)
MGSLPSTRAKSSDNKSSSSNVAKVASLERVDGKLIKISANETNVSDEIAQAITADTDGTESTLDEDEEWDTEEEKEDEVEEEEEEDGT